jgi:hypothetical protein
MNKQELSAIAEKLIRAGEDKEEMEYWLDIYDDLPEEEKKNLADNLQNELQALLSDSEGAI